MLLYFFILPFLQMQQWLTVEGDRHLLEAKSVEDSGDRMEQILNSFTGFLIEANVSQSLLLAVFVLLCVSLFFFLPSFLRTVDTMP